MKVLIIGYVWPEPTSSAAGLRTYNLIEAFSRRGWDVTVASGSAENSFTEALRLLGHRTLSILVNDPSFDASVKSLNPDIVVFDRFVTEEQFGWRVQAQCPDALRVCDSQDLHFLRKAREKAAKSETGIEQVLAAGRNLDEPCLRELGSFYRSDLTLVISDYEVKLLSDEFQFPERLLHLMRFHYPKLLPSPEFSARSEFVMIGNFRHLPNWDGVQWFRNSIWPLIRKQLPEAKVKIYGAYPPREAMILSDSSLGFYVEGPTKDQFEVLRSARVNLAPLRFGAGIKGKISDGWWVGTPVVTTPIGSEGMAGSLPWGGLVAATSAEFANAAVSLYSQAEIWEEASESGKEILRTLYSKDVLSQDLISKLLELKSNLAKHRRANCVGAILGSHFYKSTKYFSKWIEEKNRKKPEEIQTRA